MIELILGGARSGKSRYAEQSAQMLSAADFIYIATAQALDAEMTTRIEHHQQTRDTRWQTIETPITLAQALRKHSHAQSAIVVDCLTLWMTNLLIAGDDIFKRERDALLATVPELPGHIYIVSNETSMGIVPLDALSRRFVDEAGRLHQQLATLCDCVTLVIAGIPLTVKPMTLKPMTVSP